MDLKFFAGTRRPDADVSPGVVDRAAAGRPLAAGNRRVVNVQAGGVDCSTRVNVPGDIEFVAGRWGYANSDIAPGGYSNAVEIVGANSYVMIRHRTIENTARIRVIQTLYIVGAVPHGNVCSSGIR